MQLRLLVQFHTSQQDQVLPRLESEGKAEKYGNIVISCSVSQYPLHATIGQDGHDDTYRQVSNIRCTLFGYEIVDHSDVVGASPVGAAPTTSSFLA